MCSHYHVRSLFHDVISVGTELLPPCHLGNRKYTLNYVDLDSRFISRDNYGSLIIPNDQFKYRISNETLRNLLLTFWVADDEYLENDVNNVIIM